MKERVMAIVYQKHLYWNEVKATFPEAWGLPPKQSRLTHGVGIKSMGILMDRILGNLHPEDPTAQGHVRACLDRLKPFCAWTEGTWDILDGAPWNSLQNTPTETRRLSNALVRAYIQLDRS